MLSEGFVKVGPSKWNRSGHGIDSIFRKFDNPIEFAILESKGVIDSAIHLLTGRFVTDAHSLQTSFKRYMETF